MEFENDKAYEDFTITSQKYYLQKNLGLNVLASNEEKETIDIKHRLELRAWSNVNYARKLLKIAK